MPIHGEMVEKMALLARLRITEEERDLFAQQLALILEYAHSLNRLSTDTIEPLAHVLPIQNVFREDEVLPSISREHVLGNEEYYKVKRVIEEQSV